jgi:hypothetical protein
MNEFSTVPEFEFLSRSEGVPNSNDDSDNGFCANHAVAAFLT